MKDSLHQLLFSVLSFSLLLTGVCLGQTTERVSVDSQGVEGNSGSSGPSISADGRYVAFRSMSFNLVPGDTNGWEDIFVHNRQTGAIERVSVSSQGAQANSWSYYPSISADGRYVAFQSQASNLVPGDTNGVYDIFVHDRYTGVTERVSVDSLGAEGNGRSENSSISAEGRYVVFTSSASNLVPGDTNWMYDTFVHDRQTGVTERVSVDSQGAEGNSGSRASSISADGRYVAFDSHADNFEPGDMNRTSDVFVHDRHTGVTERVSVSSQGAEGNSPSSRASISADGRYVAFESYASNLVVGDTNGRFGSDIFVYDRQTSVTERVSVSSQGAQASTWSFSPSISADGRHVAFSSGSYNLVPGDTNWTPDIFVHDRQFGVTERLSVSSQGAEGNFPSSASSISTDGRYVAFHSQASNLVPGDTNGDWDVFVHDRWNGHGANSIYLTGPTTAPVGVPLELNWAIARPNSKYWLAYSNNTNGFNISGHSIDLGLFFTVTATGLNTSRGTGSFTSSPIPPRAAGSTLYFEVLARDANGILYDSNALAIDFN